MPGKVAEVAKLAKDVEKVVKIGKKVADHTNKTNDKKEGEKPTKRDNINGI